MKPIFIITGPPAAGKSTLSQAILQRFEFGIHVPVDNLREFVVSGIASPVGWTDETTRQFSLAEEAAADLAVRYQDAGFAVAIDHCQGPPTLESLIERRLEGRKVHKIAIVCSLEKNHERNLKRRNKSFGPEILTATIETLNPLYRTSGLETDKWIVFDNTEDGIEAAAEHLLQLIEKPA